MYRRLLALCRRVLEKCGIRIKPRPRLLGRVACLGQNVSALRYPSSAAAILINQQKVRVDILLDWLQGEIRPDAAKVRSHLMRDDVYPLIEQQASLPWFAGGDFDYLLMDSFAELTDQKFTHKQEGWSFCCHYTDLNHAAPGAEMYACAGLMPIEQFESAYQRFFDWFEATYPGKQVVFIHFPATLDERQLFRQRAEEIRRVMADMVRQRPYIQNLYIDEADVKAAEGDSFPYHFSSQTNLAFLRKWSASN